MNVSELATPIPFRWQINGKLCVFAFCFLPLLVSLGGWQIARAQQKLTLSQTIATEQAKPAVDFADYKNTVNPEGFSYRAVTLTGRFIAEHYWLIENKTFNGQTGFEVVMPVQADTGDIVLVNRGWLKGSGDRQHLPMITTPAGVVQLQGWLTTPSHNRLLTGAVSNAGWPKLILQLNFAQQEQELGRTLWPQVLQLQEQSMAALTTHWQPINMPAAKHYGYAVQWFAMALALAILTFIANSNFVQWMKQK